MGKTKTKTVRRSKGLTASSGRLARRSPEQVEKIVVRIVKIVAKAGPKGMRAEQIRVKLGIDVRELPRPLRVACNTGRLQWDGRCRATRYYAV